MKIIRINIGKDNEVLTEGAAEVHIELDDNRRFILRHSGETLIVLANENYSQTPVRRMYSEPISQGIILYQWLPEDD